jgi:hypothetical protein
VNPNVWCGRIEELQAENKALKELLARLFEHGAENDGTNFPFWVIACKAGVAHPVPVVILSDGIWFSRKAAAEHFEAKRHNYPKSAFVWCASAHASPGGLGGLMKAARQAIGGGGA